ncbi:MAG TPA: hypothetical protein PLC08_06825 [Candidatus Bipolaricaulis sp.]|nr:hypothetical protein [Candidatus Bipolaricaulis sp.]HRU10733.1 hypothetical protein [Thermoanaerobaculia bacterium]
MIPKTWKCPAGLSAASRNAAQAGGVSPQFQEPIKDPARFPWHEVTKVQHYWLEVDALMRPMQVRESQVDYGYGG